MLLETLWIGVDFLKPLSQSCGEELVRLKNERCLAWLPAQGHMDNCQSTAFHGWGEVSRSCWAVALPSL